MAIAIGEDVGLSKDEVDRFTQLEPSFGQSFEVDASAASRFFLAGQVLIDRLPPRPRRSEREQSAAEAIHQQLRETRLAFLRPYVARLYMQLTDEMRSFVRVENLVLPAAPALPGL